MLPDPVGLVQKDHGPVRGKEIQKILRTGIEVVDIAFQGPVVLQFPHLFAQSVDGSPEPVGLLDPAFLL